VGLVNFTIIHKKDKKMKNLFAIGMAFIALHASASSTNCSNADQTFSYSHSLSNGGAPLDMTVLKYHGKTQIHAYNFDPYVKVNIDKKADISQQVDSHTQVTTTHYAAVATGEIHADGESTPFVEWVICKLEVSPMVVHPEL
jgi:hypothetical protein